MFERALRAYDRGFSICSYILYPYIIHFCVETKEQAIARVMDIASGGCVLYIRSLTLFEMMAHGRI